MKILLVNTVFLEANGISTFIINSAKVMSNNGIDVTISAPNIVDNQLKSELKTNNISLIEIPNRMHNPINYYFKLKHIMKNNNYDVVHVNGNSTTMAIELMAAKHANIKLRVAHSHNTTTEHPLINKLLRKTFESNVNGRLACNDAAGQWLFQNKKYTVIKNGITLEKYIFNTNTREKIRKKYKITNNDILIGHVGCFNFQKNQEFLIKLLKNMNPKYKLILVGDGQNLDSSKQQVIENGLTNQIIFTGAINNVPDYLNAFDIFALPSRYEGQPYVVIEALASGLPVIVSENVSREINLTNNVKFLSLKNAVEWEKSISNLSIDDKKRKETSIHNVNLLRSKEYDTERTVISKLIPFYEKKIKNINNHEAR